MVSRRNIRVKVVQALYAVESDEGNISADKALVMLKKYLDQTSDLFLFLVFLITEVANYALIDAKNKASKHLPTQSDLDTNTKIVENTILLSIIDIKGFRSEVKERGISKYIDEEIVKKIYINLTETELYKEYISNEKFDKKEDKNIMSFIFTDLIMADENVTEYIEDQFVHWDDDAEMIYQMMLNFFNKPTSYNLEQLIGEEKKEYAINLLKTAIEKRSFTLDMITPKLKNWDADRIAVLDMIILRLGVCEMLFFETIPAKVTINEYIDIAKSYSTNQSGHFVNGILDNIHKELASDGKLKKIDFKKN
jgi:N utilization substance protein B